jgi:hypothetical protein
MHCAMHIPSAFRTAQQSVWLACADAPNSGRCGHVHLHCAYTEQTMGFPHMHTRAHAPSHGSRPFTYAPRWPIPARCPCAPTAESARAFTSHAHSLFTLLPLSMHLRSIHLFPSCCSASLSLLLVFSPAHTISRFSCVRTFTLQHAHSRVCACLCACDFSACVASDVLRWHSTAGCHLGHRRARARPTHGVCAGRHSLAALRRLV